MTCFRRAVLVSIAGAFSIGACLATPTESSESVTSAAEDVSSTSAGLSFPYVFSTFFGDASQLLIYTSNDALNFNLFSATGYHGPSGTVRDPSIRKESDGTYYVTFTTPPGAGCCGPESTFAIAKSKDLKDWTTIATVPSGIADTHNTWAPEWFQDLDGSVYILASVSPTGGKDFRTYAYKAHNATYTSFSEPIPTGIGPGYIDTFVVTVGKTYHAFIVNETTLYIEHATASSLFGPWSIVGKGNWAGWGTHREAPAVIHLPDGTWRAYMDGGSKGHELSSDSDDTFVAWTAPKTLPKVGDTVSHGTVIKAD